MGNINAVHKAHPGQIYAKPNTSQKRLDAAAKATATKRAKREARWAAAKAAQCLPECEIVAIKYPPYQHEPGCPKEAEPLPRTYESKAPCRICGQLVCSNYTPPANTAAHTEERLQIISLAAQALGSLGGSVKGDSKRRPIDYADLAKLSHAKRKANREKS